MYRKLNPLPRCILCGEPKQLVLSHVVPNFFRRWMAKELGEAPRFQNPHTRVGQYHQDLSKHRLCCSDCELAMSRDEAFAQKKFLVEWQIEGARPLCYESWMARFLAGMAAKAAAVLLHSPPSPKRESDIGLPFNQLTRESLPELERDMLAKAFEVWRQFVLGKLSTPGCHELHLLGVDTNRLPGLQGVLGHNYLHSADCSGILILLNGVAAIGVVRGSSDFVRRSTRVAIRQGWVGPQNYDIPSMMKDVLKDLSDANVNTRQIERQLLEAKQSIKQ